jgi:5'-methylthioadenosine phosphorylase
MASKRVEPPEGNVEIGIFGGTGNYDPALVEDAREIKVYTPYGPPSDFIYVGWVKGRKVAFLARHGKRHVYPNYRVNWRANVWAMKELGVKRIISPCAVGSLQPGRIKPYEFVVCNDMFDRTTIRRCLSFYEGGVTGHVPFAEPTCPELRKVILNTAREVLPDVVVHPTPEEEARGEPFTYVTIEGPRFGTRAENRFYRVMGFSVVGMTAGTEAMLCREVEICYAVIALVTDLDVDARMPVSAERVARSVRENIKNVNKLLYEVIPRIPRERKCFCGTVLDISLY